MYSFIENYIKSNDIEITSTFFNLNESVELIDSDNEESKNKLISLYKILSPRHLLDIKDEKDKMIVFERGQLVFIFNFHPNNSYESYLIGTHWKSPHMILFDTDEERFGGHTRLNGGHG